MSQLVPDDARIFWKALLDNASSLIADASVLLRAGSHARAQSLTVLACEELGKALWIYETFERAWSRGATEPQVVEDLARHRTSHTQKYLKTTEFGDELAAFWGDYSAHRQPEPGESWEQLFVREDAESLAAARTANRNKQRGFYVDRDADGTAHAPASVPAEGIDEQLNTAAQVVEMLLIKDHTRMKHDATTPYDSTYAQQFRLLPVSHPQEFVEWEASQNSDDETGGGSA